MQADELARALTTPWPQVVGLYPHHFSPSGKWPLLDTNRLLAEVSEFTFPTVSVVGGTFDDIPGKPCTNLLLQDRPELLNDTRGLLSTGIRNPIGYFPFISFRAMF